MEAVPQTEIEVVGPQIDPPVPRGQRAWALSREGSPGFVVFAVAAFAPSRWEGCSRDEPAWTALSASGALDGRWRRRIGSGLNWLLGRC
jgi:hypothetical protein